MTWSDPLVVSELCVRILAVGAAVAAIELLFMRSYFSERGLFAWRITRTAIPFMARSAQPGPARTAHVVDALMATPVVVASLVLLLVSAAWVAVLLPGLAVAVSVAAALSLLLNLRLPFGLDGSDQVRAGALAVLAVAFLQGSTQFARLALWFLALHLVMSYAIAAVAKLLGAEWRQGTALSLVLRTRSYGSPWLVERGFPTRATGRLLCWTVIGLELLLALSLLLPLPVFVGVLLAGMLFHVATAFLMGLNTFVWAYLGAYPALWYCHAHLRELLA